jgi:tripartite-type tricarboxylate transporter receptor subunit TctC
MTHRLALLLAAACLGPFPAGAAPWPERPLQLVVPFPAGGTVDMAGRQFAQALAAQLKQPVAVLNRDGGSGTIGTTAVASAAPDGYTLGFIPNGPLTVQPTLNRKLAYSLDSVKPVCQVFSYPYVLAVRRDSPHATLQDFLAAAQAAPKPLAYGFGGVGTAPHFAMLQLGQASRTKFLGVPYRGDPPTAVALKGGEVEAAVLTVEVARQLGFKLLAVFDGKRQAALPQVPTAAEQGADVVAATTVGLFAPAATPPAVLSTLASACAAVTRSAAFRAGMQKMNQSVDALDATRFEAALRADTEIKRRLIESSGIRQE